MNFWYSVSPIAAVKYSPNLHWPIVGSWLAMSFSVIVAVRRTSSIDLLLLRHLRDVLVVHRIAVLPAVGLDEREQAAIDVEQLVVA